MDIQYKSDVDVEIVQSMGGDQVIGHAARVSTKGQLSADGSDIPEKELKGLIGYLMQHRHGTPFEHSAVTFFVRAPIFVWREWHRHRVGFSYNEESGRYKTLDPVFYIPDRNRPMIKIEGWKPGRPKFRTLDEEAKETYPLWDQSIIASGVAARKYEEIVADMKEGYESEYARYLRQLARNLDPGLARDNLPVGIYSSCWVTANPRSLMHFLSLRTHEPEAKFVSYPLWEIELAARVCETLFATGWPITYSSYLAHGRVAP